MSRIGLTFGHGTGFVPRWVRPVLFAGEIPPYLKRGSPLMLMLSET
jgi:hypothetical protein